MKKQELLSLFDRAKKEETEFLGVIIDTGINLEWILIPNEYLDAKKEFYMQAYDSDLRHVMNDKVKIVDANYFNDSFLYSLIQEKE